jgi:hypothetical protein
VYFILREGMLEWWEEEEVGVLRVEICDGGVVVLGERDEFMACAFDDGEGNEFVGHCVSVSILVILRCYHCAPRLRPTFGCDVVNVVC